MATGGTEGIGHDRRAEHIIGFQRRKVKGESGREWLNREG